MRHSLTSNWCKLRVGKSIPVWSSLRKLRTSGADKLAKIHLDVPGTAFDLYLFKVSVVAEFPDSVVLKDPATMVDAEVVA